MKIHSILRQRPHLLHHSPRARRWLTAVVALVELSAALPAAAQVGEARRTISLGFSGGCVMNNVTFDPTIKQTMHNGPTMGLTVRFVSEKYFKTLCALQMEVNYARLGWTEDIRSSADQPLPDTYSRHMDYLRIPLLARLSWGYERRGFSAAFIAGPEFGYLLGESSRRSAEWTLDAEGNPDRPNGMSAQYDMPVEHRFDYAITGGLSLEIATAIGRFALDGRYTYGLADLFSNGKKDVFSRSNHSTITVKLSYLFDVRK